MRNHEGLPYRNFGNDIDILIRSSDKNVVKAIFADMKDVRITGYIERAYVFSFFVSGINWGKNKNAIEIDFVTSLSWKGLSYLNVDLGWRKRPISEFMTYAVVEPSRRRIARDTDCKDSLSIAGGRGAMAPDAVCSVLWASNRSRRSNRHPGFSSDHPRCLANLRH